jgi:hypothetical protein
MAMQTNNVIIQIGDDVKILEGEELTAFNNMRAEIEAEAAVRQAQAEAKAQAKAELLQRLGISEEEAKLLLA